MEMGEHDDGFRVWVTEITWGYDSISVIVDRLTKLAHFLPIRTTDSIDSLSRFYIKEIVRLHGVLVSIVSNRDPRLLLGSRRVCGLP